MWNSKSEQNFWKKWRSRDTCVSTTLNPIQSDNEHQFTKLAKQKSRVKDIQMDSVIQVHSDERTQNTFDQHRSCILKHKWVESCSE